MKLLIDINNFVCPACGSNDTSWTEIIEDERIYECHECGSEWFINVDYEDLLDGN